mmetsp:Transcript_27402/g.52181  ORF Transcript_27402/g.52181 Transcript_27402/m.52181 type:complete len:211 (+) Transcript_27402:1052-1684(+)
MRSLMRHSCRVPPPFSSEPLLSSDTLIIVHSSAGFQCASSTAYRWPACWNISSGGPYLRSSTLCLAPNLLQSQTFTLLSADELARMPLWCGLHSTVFNSSLCESSTCSGVLPGLSFSLRRSQSFIVESADPVTMMFSSNGLQSTQCTSLLCALRTLRTGELPSRESQNRRDLSSPTLQSSKSDCGLNFTSSTVALCPSNFMRGSSCGAFP